MRLVRERTDRWICCRLGRMAMAPRSPSNGSTASSVTATRRCGLGLGSSLPWPRLRCPHWRACGPGPVLPCPPSSGSSGHFEAADLRALPFQEGQIDRKWNQLVLLNVSGSDFSGACSNLRHAEKANGTPSNEPANTSGNSRFAPRAVSWEARALGVHDSGYRRLGCAGRSAGGGFTWRQRSGCGCRPP
jgi:hypothetical protein